MLPQLYPDQDGMRVSHETIYRSLFVQTRGELRRELTAHLRTGRTGRKPQGRARSTAGWSGSPRSVSGRPRPPTGQCQGTGKGTC